MKRTPLKRKKPMSRRPKSPKAKAKAETWRLLSLYIRYRDAIKTTGGLDNCACVTCGRVKPTRGAGCIQAGHFIPGRHNSILYDYRGIAGQCAYCNDHMKGNWVPYQKYMQETYGQEVIDELMERDKETRSWTIGELEALQAELREKLAELGAPDK